MINLAKSPTDSSNWYKDRYQHVLLQRKLLALITLASLACTLGAVLAIAYLAPQKSVEPFVIQVDQKSGITQVVDPLSMPELTANEAVNNFFIVEYIRAREGYSTTDLARNYEIVRVLSEGDKVYSTFRAEADPNNPRSNAARLGNTGVRTVKVRSITYLNTPGSTPVAQVRMVIEERGDNIGYSEQHKIATIAFEYVKMNLTPEERYINPLGFRVKDYRIDEEVMQK